MTETPTLAQQLRATVEHDIAHGFPPDHRVIEAAAALEERDEQAAQIAELTKERDQARWEVGYQRGMYQASQDQCDRQKTQIAERDAQIEALRDALAVAVRQNEHDMLMTGEELRTCRAALMTGLQTIDAAMAAKG
jgi:hypothetical protein